MRQAREPMFNVPGVVMGTLLLLAAIHAARVWVLGEDALLWDFAFIPARLAEIFGVDPLQALTEELSRGPDSEELQDRLAIARDLAIEGDAKPWTLLTYALLHGGWAHLIVNSVWLVAFGSAVARRFGALRFVGFLAVTAVGGALGHLVTNPDDVVPMVGASAAISGCMAAAIRFAFQPGAPLGGFSLPGEDSYRLPALPLGAVLRERRAMTFLLVWMAMNVATGLGAREFGLTDASIAWQAHIGGFLFGLLAFPLFDPPPPRWMTE